MLMLRPPLGAWSGGMIWSRGCGMVLINFEVVNFLYLGWDVPRRHSCVVSETCS